MTRYQVETGSRVWTVVPEFVKTVLDRVPEHGIDILGTAKELIKNKSVSAKNISSEEINEIIENTADEMDLDIRDQSLPNSKDSTINQDNARSILAEQGISFMNTGVVKSISVESIETLSNLYDDPAAIDTRTFIGLAAMEEAGMSLVNNAIKNIISTNQQNFEEAATCDTGVCAPPVTPNK